eukprot:12413-Chlamydomonas_euryale.AAC.2
MNLGEWEGLGADFHRGVPNNPQQRHKIPGCQIKVSTSPVWATGEGLTHMGRDQISYPLFQR